MSFTRVLVCVVAAMLCSPVMAEAKPALKNASQKSATMRVHGQALPPFGFVHFCERHRSECVASDRIEFSRLNATTDHLRQLDAINRHVNKRVTPVTDIDLYGREEYWTFPAAKGDCEDYVVLKRRMLMQAGWPASALLITVVRDENGEGHAVLTVRTKQGDYILDNKINDLRLWSKTPYQFLMRQSYLNPLVWMALDPRYSNSVTATTVAGVD